MALQHRSDVASRLGRISTQLQKLPITWRLVVIAVLNTTLLSLLVFFVISGVSATRDAWAELVKSREADRRLTNIEAEAGKLQSLIHRYFTQPDPHLLVQIDYRRKQLSGQLDAISNLDAQMADAAQRLRASNETLVRGFDELRRARNRISSIYEADYLRTARDVRGLFGLIESTIPADEVLLRPILTKARDSFSAALMAGNAFYLSQSANAAQEAISNLDSIRLSLPVMDEIASEDLRKRSIAALGDKIVQLKAAQLRLADAFDAQRSLLRDQVDQSQVRITEEASAIAEQFRAREAEVQTKLDDAIGSVYLHTAIAAFVFLLMTALLGAAVAKSIIRPLQDVMDAMDDIAAGKLDKVTRGTQLRDEIGHMARALEVFRSNAEGRLQAESDLVRAKDSAEKALDELRLTQRSLVEAEKLAALGGLVAGVAHEVNNPVGISLTVASSLGERCQDFEREVKSDSLRRSKLNEFISDVSEAARQLNRNLERAADLIRSFKQVAVDRTHSDCRKFDVREVVEQIVLSLRPSLNTKRVDLEILGEGSVYIESDPGALGQVLTNLVLNSATHAFPGDIGGRITIAISARAGSVRIEFSDDGVGMTGEVLRKAFEPFFTTRRGQGGTGLGLHIVYNVVTARLGGTISVSSTPGLGTRFIIDLPTRSPDTGRAEAA